MVDFLWKLVEMAALSLAGCGENLVRAACEGKAITPLACGAKDRARGADRESWKAVTGCCCALGLAPCLGSTIPLRSPPLLAGDEFLDGITVKVCKPW